VRDVSGAWYEGFGTGKKEKKAENPTGFSASSDRFRF
jgi:hypothetical protein